MFKLCTMNAMGAAIIEFHVVLEKITFGPDSASLITFKDLKLITGFNNDFNEIKIEHKKN